LSLSLNHALATSRVSLVGFAAGILNGLIGIGGGVVIVPALIVHRQATPQQAVGSSLTAMVVFSTLAFALHFFYSPLSVTAVHFVVVIIAGIVGARLGAWLLSGLTTRWMLLLFSAFVFVMSARLLIQGLGLFEISATAITTPPTWAYATVGVFAGVCSGMFGIGGGGMVLLGLAVFFGLPVREGIPLALVVNVANAVSGSLHHARAGRVLWDEVWHMMPAAIVGIALGTVLAVWLPPDWLRVTLAGFFLFTAFRIGKQGLSR